MHTTSSYHATCHHSVPRPPHHGPINAIICTVCPLKCQFWEGTARSLPSLTSQAPDDALHLIPSPLALRRHSAPVLLRPLPSLKLITLLLSCLVSPGRPHPLLCLPSRPQPHIPVARVTSPSTRPTLVALSHFHRDASESPCPKETPPHLSRGTQPPRATPRPPAPLTRAPPAPHCSLLPAPHL